MFPFDFVTYHTILKWFYNKKPFDYLFLYVGTGINTDKDIDILEEVVVKKKKFDWRIFNYPGFVYSLNKNLNSELIKKVFTTNDYNKTNMHLREVLGDFQYFTPNFEVFLDFDALTANEICSQYGIPTSKLPALLIFSQRSPKPVVIPLSSKEDVNLLFDYMEDLTSFYNQWKSHERQNTKIWCSPEYQAYLRKERIEKEISELRNQFTPEDQKKAEETFLEKKEHFFGLLKDNSVSDEVIAKMEENPEYHRRTLFSHYPQLTSNKEIEEASKEYYKAYKKFKYGLENINAEIERIRKKFENDLAVDIDCDKIKELNEALKDTDKLKLDCIKKYAHNLEDKYHIPYKLLVSNLENSVEDSGLEIEIMTLFNVRL